MSKPNLFLVFSERFLDGELMDSHNMRREFIRAKNLKQHISVIEVDEDLKKNLAEVLLDE